MNVLKELYKICAEDINTQAFLAKSDADILKWLDTTIADSEKELFLDFIDSVCAKQSEFFFYHGFNLAKDLLIKKTD